MAETYATNPPDRGSAETAATSAATPLPYRWGYFQGAVIIPISLLTLIGSIADLVRLHTKPWPVSASWLLMALLGLPLGVGLLKKRWYALTLLYVMLWLSVLLVVVKLPVAIGHFTDAGDIGSALPEAELLLIWLLSTVYYRKRQMQFG